MACKGAGLLLTLIWRGGLRGLYALLSQFIRI
ncbi:hypothetical protein M8C21_003554 [Ambrosia artemisiifolia]|uniref:Uncharacterized protein n=1 Tax=Ambrosia artemisiifolia TaxID=4212 RepID=A0AAD5CK48_AMBAR|nr:hypothetical protein M8C21_003554 [Ambrosia artemisiifolia]